MKLNVQMIGLDLDGTLLNSQKQLTSLTADTLKQAVDQGIRVVLATGRPLGGIPQELKEFPGLQYAVTANGSRIVDLVSGNTLYEKLVEAKLAKRILKLFGTYDTLREVYFDGMGYAKKEDLERITHYMEDKPMAQYIVKTRQTVEDVETYLEQQNRGVDKVQALFRSREDKEEARRVLCGWQEVEVTGSLSNNLEINARGVDKGQGLLWLANRLQIPVEALMVFGDGDNDRGMLRLAGMGVAMGNGLPEVKEEADYLAGSNDEDGIGKFLQQYVL
ncbi:Cof-type HAD-IIB family hydrolase [Suipraeoptans intestinalis]|uniref:Cof-type HAD-IIB family hydrolase n=1 Tax=Suipraeoptans intestinalis TaxID=2606628 RepID=UPI002A761D25|nr:Cof-type HAD-IIB family hydrolase [Suipraeoptans intestinalis]MDY3121396.1 Cof-type HAD-IIB family hydrolase [Suipraeoptans intestinalis]